MSGLPGTNRLHEKLNFQAHESLWTPHVCDHFEKHSYMRRISENKSPPVYWQSVAVPWQYMVLNTVKNPDFLAVHGLLTCIDHCRCLTFSMYSKLPMHPFPPLISSFSFPFSCLPFCHLSLLLSHRPFLLPLISLLSSGNPYLSPPSLYPPPSLCISLCSIALYDL